MINWHTIFDEMYPEAGASENELQRLIAQIGRPLPTSYLSLLRWSNGGEFRTGERWFQFFEALKPSHGVLAMTEAYLLSLFMPGALAFAFNGGGVLYVFDLRQDAIEGEYPIFCTHAGNQGWETDECVLVADTFMKACRGNCNVEDLLYKRTRQP